MFGGDDILPTSDKGLTCKKTKISRHMILAVGFQDNLLCFGHVWDMSWEIPTKQIQNFLNYQFQSQKIIAKQSLTPKISLQMCHMQKCSHLTSSPLVPLLIPFFHFSVFHKFQHPPPTCMATRAKTDPLR